VTAGAAPTPRHRPPGARRTERAPPPAPNAPWSGGEPARSATCYAQVVRGPMTPVVNRMGFPLSRGVPSAEYGR
ncbi:hypothetical protein, partial [Kitasatospora sp. NPDC057936]|uniref:hypothetical protein n=1 Tax=Kitasatospora sp. NPDC057936 TaxID=3346283 RepID=UPI0036DA5681